MNKVLFTITLFTILTILPFNLFGQGATPTPTPVAAKTGTLDDCKIIISEGCRSYLLQAKASDILLQRSDAVVSNFNTLVTNEFKGELAGDKGKIYSAEFSGEFNKKRNRPAENLKWEESVKSVIKKYGEPLEIRLDIRRAYHTYKDFQFQYFDNKLSWVVISRDKTESETAAVRVFNDRSMEAERILRNAPVDKTKSAIAAYRQAVTEYNRLMAYHNKKVEEMNRAAKDSKIAYDILGIWNIPKADQALRDMRKVLSDLLAKHGENLPPNMKSQITSVLKGTPTYTPIQVVENQ